jgi:hypothetical protein
MIIYNFKNTKASKIVLLLALGFTAACARDEPPRDVSNVSSSNTSTLFKPTTSSASSEGIQITYAQVSLGFDAGCNPFKSFSSDLNQCAKLPETVKGLATAHCDTFNKKAIFVGNKTNLLQMTVSKFKCEQN